MCVNMYAKHMIFLYKIFKFCQILSNLSSFFLTPCRAAMIDQGTLLNHSLREMN
jgi:hypothetical protein